MKAISSRFVLALAVLAAPLPGACSAPEARLNVTVRDEQGRAVEGAAVRGSFFQDRVIDRVRSPSHSGVTDGAGQVSLIGHEGLYVDVIAEKAGYYPSTHRAVVRGGGVREVPILLRPMRSPIAMYARQATVTLPELDRTYGYDLLRGELVPPGGAGLHEDILLRMERPARPDGAPGLHLTVSFPGQADGIAAMTLDPAWADSAYPSAYTAPLDGYEDKLSVSVARTPNGYEDLNRRRPFFLRIRAQQDADGHLRSALYCKIWPGMDLLGWAADWPTVALPYYCNPTENDRNLEFAPDRNLFRDLTPDERPAGP
jgi:hypothetical protein